jgi:hypothetical protein
LAGWLLVHMEMHPIDGFDDETLRCRTTGLCWVQRLNALWDSVVLWGLALPPTRPPSPSLFQHSRKHFHGRWPNKSRHHIKTISQLHWNQRRREIRQKIKPRKTYRRTAVRCRDMARRCSPDILISSSSSFWGYRHFRFSPCISLSSHYEKVREDVRVCKLY